MWGRLLALLASLAREVPVQEKKVQPREHDACEVQGAENRCRLLMNRGISTWARSRDEERGSRPAACERFTFFESGFAYEHGR